MFKKLLAFGLVQLAIAMVSIAVWLYAPKSDRFVNNYLFGALDNVERLKESLGEKRVILLGGSSLGLGVSAEQLSESLGIRVLNLGVHAGIGYEEMWEMYSAYMNPATDIIVLSPEYSFVSNPGFGDEFGFIIFLSRDLGRMLHSPQYFPYVVRKSYEDLFYRVTHSRHHNDVYIRKAFNSHGDVVSHYRMKRTNFVCNARMAGEKALDTYLEYISRTIIKDGFQVCYVPTTVPDSCCQKMDQMLEFQLRMGAFFHQDVDLVRGNLCFPDDLFFDTTYHMNYGGVERKTRIFLDRLKSCLGGACPARTESASLAGGRQ